MKLSELKTMPVQELISLGEDCGVDPGEEVGDVGEHIRQILRLKVCSLGMPHVSKSDEFFEKFQTAFDPPPSFSESYIAIFATKL